MNIKTVHKLVAMLRRETPKLQVPVVTMIARHRRDPFKVLISCLLSLRTNDKTTLEASKRLFDEACTPEGLLKLTEKRLVELIYPVGFYRTKAKVLKGVCRDILKKHDGKVPHGMEELLQMKGVGRKTANLVRTQGFGLPGICVDTHVHRISNRLGLVRTPTPEKTEFALRAKLPPAYWIEFNDELVAWGQSVCRPISPKCSACALKPVCKRVGVTLYR